MNYTTAIMLVNDNIRAVKCIYEPDSTNGSAMLSKRTLFKTLDKSIAIGDFVIVPSDMRHKMTTVKVVEVDAEVDFESSIQVDWIIGKISMANYTEINAAEELAIQAIKAAERTRKKNDLRAKLLEHDAETLKHLPITNMTGAPVALTSSGNGEAA